MSGQQTHTANFSAVTVVGDSIISFSSKVSGQQLRDVQNSVLFAGRVASKVYPKERGSKDWYDEFHKALNQLGWIIQEHSFNQYSHAPQQPFRLVEATLDLLTKFFEGDLLSVVKGTFNCLINSPSELTRFEEHCASDNSAHFQILPCTVEKGQVSLTLIGNYFEAPEVSDNCFSRTYNPQEICLYTAKTTLTLNEEVYGKSRQEVVDRLGKSATKFIREINI